MLRSDLRSNYARPQVNEIKRKPVAAPKRNSGLRIAAVLLLAAAVGVAVYFLVVRQSPTTASTQTNKSAVPVSEAGLETLASLGRPIYWAGPKRGDTYQLTQSSGGRVFVSYLPAGVNVGSAGLYLTVATYPITNAFAVTQTIAKQSGSVTIPIGGGGIAFYKADLPTNIYLAYPGSQYQVEVFDPSAAEAHALVENGGITKVAAKATSVTVPKTAAVAASVADLQTLATRLGRPLYWAGTKAATTYELTQTPDGRVFVRYLPLGVKTGSDELFLTVGTYPLPNAYAVTLKKANAPGAVKIKIHGGGIAFYDTSLPTSVYMAYPKTNEQIEVFDPSASIAQSTVAGLKIHAIS